MPYGPNAMNIEPSLRYGQKSVGFYEEVAIPLLSMRTAAGLTLTASTDPSIEAVGTNGLAIMWAFDDDAADLAIFETTLPRNFRSIVDPGNGKRGSLKLRVLARKVDATDENTDLDLRVQLFAFSQSDTAYTTLTTPVDKLLATSTAAADLSSFAWYEFDLGAALRAESKRVDGGDFLKLQIGPDDTVGATDMKVQVMSVLLCYERHATYPDRTLIDA